MGRNTGCGRRLTGHAAAWRVGALGTDYGTMRHVTQTACTAVRSRLVAGAALAATLSGLTLLGAGPAAAAPGACAAVVRDGADVLDKTAVAAAVRAADLEATKVRILTFDRSPGGKVGAAVDAARGACPAWQGPGTALARDLVVIAVAVSDRDAGVFYGSGHDDDLGHRQWERVVDAMTPGFGDGDFTGGMIAGIDELDDLVDKAPAPAGPGDDSSFDDTPTYVDSTGSDSSAAVPWGRVLGVPLGLGALGGAGWGGMTMRRRVRDRAAARAGAAAASDAAAAAFLRLEEVAEFTAARVAALPQVVDEEIAAVRRLGAAAVAQSETATAAYLTHTEEWTAEKIAAADAGTARAAQHEAESATTLLAGATESWTRAEAMITELEAAAARTPGVLDETETRIADIRTQLVGLAAEGFRTEPYQQACDDADAAVSAARATQDEKRWGAAAAAAAAVSAATTATLAATTGLRERHAAIQAEVERLRTHHAALAGALAAADRVVAELDGSRHSECVTDLRAVMGAGHDTHADARTTIEGAATAATMEVQDFDEADALLAAGRDQLAAATEAAAAPGRRRDDLMALAQKLPGRLRIPVSRPSLSRRFWWSTRTRLRSSTVFPTPPAWPPRSRGSFRSWPGTGPDSSRSSSRAPRCRHR